MVPHRLILMGFEVFFRNRFGLGVFNGREQLTTM
jgi:hypothetical protein